MTVRNPNRYTGQIPKEQRKLIQIFMTEKEYVDWLLFLKREHLSEQEFVRGAICGVLERKENITNFIMDLAHELHKVGTRRELWEKEKSERRKTIEDFGLSEEDKQDIYNNIAKELLTGDADED